MQVSAKRTGNWLRVGGRSLAVIGMVSWMSGCAPLLDQNFWDEATSFADENYTAQGLQQLASGDYASAERLFDKALRKIRRMAMRFCGVRFISELRTIA